jgi:hypothetical protein
MLKKMLVSCLVAGMFCQVMSQNARVDAMAGMGILSDITNIYGIPAYVNDYGDLLQATTSFVPGTASLPNSFSFGPAFGVKSIADKVNLGFFIRRESVMRSPFYYESRVYLSRIFKFTTLNTASFVYTNTINPMIDILRAPESGLDTVLLPPPLPHLLLGVNLGKVTIGLDAYYEYSGKRIEKDDTLGIHVSTDRFVRNPGAKLSVNINLEPFFISPVVGYGMPKMKGTYERASSRFLLSQTDTSKDTAGKYLNPNPQNLGDVFKRSAESSNEAYWCAGNELWCKIKNFNFVLGGFVTQENYNLKSDSLHAFDTITAIIDRSKFKGMKFNPISGGTDSVFDTVYNVGVYNNEISNGSFSNRFVDAYTGFTADLYDGLMLAAEYFVTWKNQSMSERHKLRNNYGVSADYLINSKIEGFIHTLYIGAEKPIKGFWIFDHLIPRAGMRWTFTNLQTTSLIPLVYNLFPSSLPTNTSRYPDSASLPILTVGLGLKAGMATIDTRMELGQWNGAIAGPLGAEATLTLDFKAARKAAMNAPHAMEPLPVPAVKPEAQEAKPAVEKPAPEPKAPAAVPEKKIAPEEKAPAAAPEKKNAPEEKAPAAAPPVKR